MTVQEILKQTGLTDEQIAGLDAKIVNGFTTVLTTAATAEQQAAAAREEAQRAERSYQDMWQNQISPALDGWANEKANVYAERDFYKTLAEKAKEGGFVPKDAPSYTAPAAQRDPGNGQFVAGGNTVPGSPAYLTKDEAFKGMTNAMWVMAEHQRLYGSPMPDEFESVLNESARERMGFREYASRKYKFDEKRQAIAAIAQKERDDKLRAEERAAVTKELAEKFGNNPNVRTGGPSDFDSLARAQQGGARKNPLDMTEQERRQHTRQNIQTEIAGNVAGVR